ncbi:MAG: hypothetical protein HQM12_24225 [SAR324 cluster bacterium]|nr:hypothetical protein [SAR324 cluster bacterium]
MSTATKSNRASLFENNALFRKKNQEVPVVLTPAKPRPLKDIESEILERVQMITRNKHEILKLLYVIYQNREYYFMEEGNKPDYVENFARYVRDTFQQNLSTAYDDVKIIKMLHHHESQNQIEAFQLLEERRTYKLKRVAQLQSEEKQIYFLKNIDAVTANDIKDESITPLMTARYQAVRITGMRSKYDKEKRTITIKAENHQHLDKINTLLKLLNDNNMDHILSYLSELSPK